MTEGLNRHISWIKLSSTFIVNTMGNLDGIHRSPPDDILFVSERRLIDPDGNFFVLFSHRSPNITCVSLFYKKGFH